jgi:hypothetical protein
MGPLELALKYMACFYGEAPLESMETLLAKNLRFKGPLYEFDSAKEYLESLKADPPTNATYNILETFESANSTCLIYEFSKPGVETLMAQTFEVNAGKITNIKLIFDTNAF